MNIVGYDAFFEMLRTKEKWLDLPFTYIAKFTTYDFIGSIDPVKNDGGRDSGSFRIHIAKVVKTNHSQTYTAENTVFNLDMITNAVAEMARPYGVEVGPEIRMEQPWPVMSAGNTEHAPLEIIYTLLF